MDSGVDTQTKNGALDRSADVELRLNNDDAILGTSVGEVSIIGQTEPVGQNSASMEVESDEPYVGQEFESEAAAHAFYNAYALRVGFRTRVNDLSRSRVDGSVIARTLVCNKEGYRAADKRDRKSVRPRPPTRVGCKAMISMKKMSNGNWVVAKFVKEHAHSLTPEKSDNGLNDESSDEQMKIKELTQQLMVERKRSASYRKIIDLLFNHIDDHTQHLSQKILRVNDVLRDIASSEGKSRQNLC
ncbi:protein FAR1-RELATED SEQUENCE 5-like [Argentina anserina]|uniref:protein FAR1-RELATED SEQUENCE 5-like n=1 Tax=Argentina anserina TaxID=57926 RepID=UPI0021764EF9|nr:protein FAR1-RELATED SEQUENCE 5-like [Potentilla anserina]